VSEAYLADVFATKRSSTADLYAIYLRHHVAPELGSRKITAITRADVTKLHRQIGLTKKPTANRVLNTLSGVFAFAARMGMVSEGFNPARGVSKFAEEGRERFLSVDELARLGEALREAETVGIPWGPNPAKLVKHAPKAENRRVVLSPHVTGAIRLLLFTGCRLREILHLRWCDVDLERGLLFLPTSKTGKKTVVLSTPAVQVLNELPRLGAFVVPGEKAGTKDEAPRADLKRPWSLVATRAGLNGLRLHDLRHSFASVGAGSGLGLPIIGKLLGHSQPSTTAKYAHLDANPLRRASDAIASTIAAAMGEASSGEVVPLRSAKGRSAA
jgi:integrase